MRDAPIPATYRCTHASMPMPGTRSRAATDRGEGAGGSAFGEAERAPRDESLADVDAHLVQAGAPALQEGRRVRPDEAARRARGVDTELIAGSSNDFLALGAILVHANDLFADGGSAEGFRIDDRVHERHYEPEGLLRLEHLGVAVELSTECLGARKRRRCARGDFGDRGFASDDRGWRAALQARLRGRTRAGRLPTDRGIRRVEARNEQTDH